MRQAARPAHPPRTRHLAVAPPRSRSSRGTAWIVRLGSARLGSARLGGADRRQPRRRDARDRRGFARHADHITAVRPLARRAWRRALGRRFIGIAVLASTFARRRWASTLRRRGLVRRAFARHVLLVAGEEHAGEGMAPRGVRRQQALSGGGRCGAFTRHFPHLRAQRSGVTRGVRAAGGGVGLNSYRLLLAVPGATLPVDARRYGHPSCGSERTTSGGLEYWVNRVKTSRSTARLGTRSRSMIIDQP